MSKHATVSIWQRHEDGSYAAELNGFHLTVRWTAETDEHPRGFVWTAVTPTGQRLSARESEEEIEVAMGIAEDIAEGREQPEATVE
ncbi:MAG TPA: hypothetical protein VHB21_24495 [Minicystis sp.]|nr:hypothetical protein [Minicystis sp.]